MGRPAHFKDDAFYTYAHTHAHHSSSLTTKPFHTHCCMCFDCYLRAPSYYPAWVWSPTLEAMVEFIISPTLLKTRTPCLRGQRTVKERKKEALMQTWRGALPASGGRICIQDRPLCALSTIISMNPAQCPKLTVSFLYRLCEGVGAVNVCKYLLENS